ncbi:hypothetical protein D3C85_1838250 [compost metagenome]
MNRSAPSAIPLKPAQRLRFPFQVLLRQLEKVCCCTMQIGGPDTEILIHSTLRTAVSLQSTQ